MQPPKKAVAFLRWFCREDYVEEIEGDLTEIFKRHSKLSPRQAKWKFVFSVIRYFRPGFMKSLRTDYHANPIDMLYHNLLITYRNFLRYKSSFFINLIGLSSGLACVLLIYLWVSDELNVDKFHEKDSRLYQILERQQQAGQIDVTDGTPGLLASTLADEMPEVEYAATVSWTSDYTLSVGDKNLKAVGQYAGKDYFNIFSFPLVYGKPHEVLSDKKSIVISSKLALSLFNTTENILGKTILFQHEKEFMVSGVFNPPPTNSSQQFDFILSFEEFKEAHPWILGWTNNGPSTFLVLREGSSIEQFNHKIVDFVKQHRGEQHVTLFGERYSDRYLHGRYVNGQQAGGRIEYVTLFATIASFILVIACINFMNLSTAKASRRIKEIGTKKAIGANRNGLIFQYLGESISMAFLSLLVSVAMVFLFLPQFNYIIGKNLALRVDATLVIATLSMTLLTGLISGSYPALYLSGFKPASVLKGQLHTSLGELWARKGLVVFQFAISVILIVSVMVVYKQIEFTQTKNLGYSKDNILYFEAEGDALKNLETLLSTVKNVPGVIDASSIGHSLVEGGYSSSTSSMEWDGKIADEIVEMENVRVNYGMIELLDVKMKEGRAFSLDHHTDSSKIIFNEAAIEAMGIHDPIGKVVKVWGEERQIIGVAKNFHFQSFHQNVKPLFFNLRPQDTWIVMTKVQAGNESEVISRLERLYKDVSPGFSFEYKFLDQAYQAQYANEKRVGTLSKYFAGLAIVLSCLGLFGLAAFTAERRLKEIAIRKILGSSVLDIARLLSGDFTKMVLLAIAIALPVSYLVTKEWLNGFAYQIDLEWWFFIGAGIVALLVAWITVSLQTIKAARVNPTVCLKGE